MSKFLLRYGLYSIDEEEKIIEADTYDKALIEVDEILHEFSDDDRFGRTIEDIIEEEGCSEEEATEIYDEERMDWITIELTEYKEEM